MPKAIHDRAMHLLPHMKETYPPKKAKQVAFAVATQQAEAKGQVPKGFGTPEGKHEAKKKFDKPPSSYKSLKEGALNAMAELLAGTSPPPDSRATLGLMQEGSSMFDKVGAQLTAAGREKIKPKNFALPKQKKYPIEDLPHARNALARASQHATPAQRATVRSKVFSKYPGLKERHEERTGESPTSPEKLNAPKLGAYRGKEESMNPARDLLEAIVDERGKEKLAQGFMGGGTPVGGGTAPASPFGNPGTQLGGTTTRTPQTPPPPPPQAPAAQPLKPMAGVASLASLIEDIQEQAFRSKISELSKVAQAEGQPSLRDRLQGIKGKLDEVRGRQLGVVPSAAAVGAGLYGGRRAQQALETGALEREMMAKAEGAAFKRPWWMAKRPRLVGGRAGEPLMKALPRTALRGGGALAALWAAKSLLGKPKQAQAPFG